MFKLTNVLFLLLPLALLSQNNSKDSILNPDDILIGNLERPKVLMVGSFHFSYPGLDAHVTKEDEKVNVLSPRRQKEVEELVDYIARFKPTKIAVEGGRNSGYIMHRYRIYKKDPSTLEAREMDQLGFRLLDRFQLDTIYGVDAPTLIWSLENSKHAEALEPISTQIFKDWDFTNDDPTSQRYVELYGHYDKIALNHTLLETFEWMNRRDVVNRSFGAYLTGDFKNREFDGADALSLHWYSRNLRIMRNIQRITESPNDRILVLFGAGHMSILNHLFECSPEYEMIWFDELK